MIRLNSITVITDEQKFLKTNILRASGPSGSYLAQTSRFLLSQYEKATGKIISIPDNESQTMNYDQAHNVHNSSGTIEAPEAKAGAEDINQGMEGGPDIRG